MKKSKTNQTQNVRSTFDYKFYARETNKTRSRLHALNYWLCMTYYFKVFLFTLTDYTENSICQPLFFILHAVLKTLL